MRRTEEAGKQGFIAIGGNVGVVVVEDALVEGQLQGRQGLADEELVPAEEEELSALALPHLAPGLRLGAHGLDVLLRVDVVRTNTVVARETEVAA